MLHVSPSGPQYRYAFENRYGLSIKLTQTEWTGTLYVLGPLKQGREYSVNMDTIDDKIECELAPRYHNVSHRKFAGRLSVTSVPSPFDDVVVPEVHTLDEWANQPLFANSLDGDILGLQPYPEPEDWYRYDFGDNDHGYYAFTTSNEYARLRTEYREDSTPLNVYIQSKYNFRRVYRPDEGCFARADDILYVGENETEIWNRWQMVIQKDRYYPDPEINNDLVDKAINAVRTRYKQCSAIYKPELEAAYPYSRMIYKAAENIRLLDINMISFIKEQKELLEGGYLRTLFHIDASREFSKVLHSTISNPTKLRKAVKFSASEYLGMHYGTKLTALDYADILDAHLKMKEMLDATQTMGAQQHHSFTFPDGSSVSTLRRFKAEIQSLTDQDYSIVEGSDRFMRELYEIDILPSASNIWDLIPYSFVVDWFVPLGNKLADIEEGHYIETLHPRKCFYSTKSAYLLDFNSPDFSGLVEVVEYDRLCTKRFLDGTPCVEDSSGMTVTHGIEAGALIISRFF